MIYMRLHCGHLNVRVGDILRRKSQIAPFNAIIIVIIIVAIIIIISH